MKRSLLALAASLVMACCMLGCATIGAPPAAPDDPAGQALVATQNAANALKAAIASTDAAYMAGAIKTKEARKALDSFTAADAGLQASLAQIKAAMAANAASAAAAGVKK